MIADLQDQIAHNLFVHSVSDLGLAGQGIYLVEIDKFQMLRNIVGNSLEQKCFTQRERNTPFLGVRRIQFLAGLWAAKEAVVKALERNQVPENSWLEIEIQRRETGELAIVVMGNVKAISQKLGIQRWLLSISHTSNYAVASVIALKN